MLPGDDRLLGLNALMGIDGFWTSLACRDEHLLLGLNALTGIDGFWTLITGAYLRYMPSGS